MCRCHEGHKEVESQVTWGGSRAGFHPLFTDHDSDLSAEVTWIEVGRMEGTGRRPFQVEGRAGVLLSLSEQGRLWCE